MGVPFLSFRSLICPWILRYSFRVSVFLSGTLGQNLTCFGIFLAFCLIIAIAWTLEKVQIRKREFALSFALFASKTEIGVIFASSSGFMFMGPRMWCMKICLGCRFWVWARVHLCVCLCMSVTVCVCLCV